MNKYILTVILKCGHVDLQFLTEQIHAWQIDFRDVFQDADGREEHPRFNDYIDSIYDLGFNKALEEVGLTKKDFPSMLEEHDINYAASTFNLVGDGYTHTFTNFKLLKEFLLEHKGK